MALSLADHISKDPIPQVRDKCEFLMDSIQLDAGVTSSPLTFIIGIGGGKERSRRGNMVVKH